MSYKYGLNPFRSGRKINVLFTGYYGNFGGDLHSVFEFFVKYKSFIKTSHPVNNNNTWMRENMEIISSVEQDIERVSAALRLYIGFFSCHGA